MSWEELTRLKPVAPTMGMMLETTATRLWSEKGGPHYGSPDKEPAVRLRTLTDAGRVGVPFTTGILIGIGETRVERAESLFAIRAAARAHGHVQETIVQNFRAKPDTAMANDPDADLDDLAATIAVARLVLGPKMRLQAPPNLVGDEFALMLRAGIDDWGGVSPVTADHVNPERPWPAIDELAARSAEAGSRFASGSPSTRATSWRARRGSTRGCTGTSAALADPARARPGGRPGRGPAVAGAGRRVRLLRPRRPQRHDRHRRAARTTAAATSRRSTATGTRCATSWPPRSGPARRSGWRRRPRGARPRGVRPRGVARPRARRTRPWR